MVSLTGDKDAPREYMMATGMLSSAYEGIVWEQLTGYEGVSTVSVLAKAKEENIDILLLSQENLSTEIEKLNTDETMKQTVMNAVNSGMVVTIPAEDVTMGEWSGTGYIITNPETGTGAYMITGGLNGGATTVITSIPVLLGSILSATTLEATMVGIVGLIAMLCGGGLTVAVTALTVLELVLLMTSVIIITLTWISMLESYDEYLKTGNLEAAEEACKKAMWIGIEVLLELLIDTLIDLLRGNVSQGDGSTGGNGGSDGDNTSGGNGDSDGDNTPGGNGGSDGDSTPDGDDTNGDNSPDGDGDDGNSSNGDGDGDNTSDGNDNDGTTSDGDDGSSSTGKGDADGDNTSGGSGTTGDGSSSGGNGDADGGNTSGGTGSDGGSSGGDGGTSGESGSNISTVRIADEVLDGELLKDAKAMKEKLPTWAQDTGNFGYCETSINGLDKTKYFAHSGIQTEIPSVKDSGISVKPEKSPFETLNVNGSNIIDAEDAWPRDVDTEYKILSDIQSRLGDNYSASGKIVLYTELEPCPSCLNVMKQFKDMYSNINIEVIYSVKK